MEFAVELGEELFVELASEFAKELVVELGIELVVEPAIELVVDTSTVELSDFVELKVVLLAKFFSVVLVVFRVVDLALGLVVVS